MDRVYVINYITTTKRMREMWSIRVVKRASWLDNYEGKDNMSCWLLKRYIMNINK